MTDTFCSEPNYLRFCFELELGEFFTVTCVVYCSGDISKLFNAECFYSILKLRCCYCSI